MNHRAVKIICADDHPLFTRGVELLLETKSPDLKLVRSFKNGQEVIEWLKIHPEGADVLLADMNMPEMNGRDTLRSLRLYGLSIRTIILSLYQDANLAAQLISEGARGYLTKSAAESELFEAIDKVVSGQIYICREIQEIMNETSNTSSLLSGREIEVVKLLVQGHSTIQISQALFISHHTVESHRKNILRKTACRNTVELIHYLSSNMIL